MIRDLKTNIGVDECVLQIDFSENYQRKLGTEVMSMHHSASKRQICLHNCHATFRSTENVSSTECFCTLCADTRHGTCSVWAHLKPVLVHLKSMGIRKLHFISNGPSSHYRNRTNFHLLSQIPFKMGFDSISWNFLESVHGKGPADSIGAAVKNSVDRSVAHGRDIDSLTALMQALDGTVIVKLYEIPENAADEFEVT